MSAYLNRLFIDEFKRNNVYQHVMTKFNGNGCDLIFNDFHVNYERAEEPDDRAPGEADDRLLPQELSKDDNGLYGGPKHKEIRSGICRCLTKNFTMSCFEAIPLLS